MSASKVSCAPPGVAAARRRAAAARLRGGLILFCAVAFCAAVIAVSRTPRRNTPDGARAIDTAGAVAAGRARWGLTDYTHHPMGPAYLLLPAVGLTVDERRVPALAAAVAGSAALAVLLRLAPWPLWPGVLLSFAALFWQPGYTDWLSNTWQHSWNLTLVFVLIALGCSLARAAPWLLLLGYAAGWIGYDFIFVQVAALAAVRLAFWSREPLARAGLAAADDTVAFATGFALAVLSHLAQNVLYFSSAVMAVTDLFGSVSIRLNNSDFEAPGLAARWRLLRELASAYGETFLRPSWSHWPSLAAAAGALAVGAAATVRRVRPPRFALPLAALGLTAVGGVVAWWTVAPGHALPHQHFFPRMLLVPLLAAMAGTVRLLAVTAPPPPPAWRPRWRHALTLAAIVLLQPALLRWAAARLDERVYAHVWATPDSAPRADRLDGEFIAATSPQAPGPARLKRGWPLVGGVNVWALNLEDERWQPRIGARWIYEIRFARRSAVQDVLLRFPNQARAFGTVRAFTVELLDAAPPTRLHDALPPPEAVDVGFLRCLRYRLEPPVAASGLRLTVRDADRVPVLYDLLAFGRPAP